MRLLTFLSLFGILSASTLELAARSPVPPAASSDTTKLDPAMAANAKTEGDIVWHDVSSWGVEGREFGDLERHRYFDRLPKQAEGQVTSAVWNLSRDSAGMMARFRTNATEIHARYGLVKSNLAMAHMSATGVSGLDLYARDEKTGRWRWVQVTKPANQQVEAQIINGLDGVEREFAAYLPLYNGVEKLEIGVPRGASFEGLKPREKKPIVFYGTSITHGACASRPGMVHTAILGRRFDRPVVNLGFSGNGKMDAAVGDYLTRIDAAVYVIDCLPNMNADLVKERCIPLVKQLRQARPDTPILLVEDRRFTNDWILPAKSKFHDDNHAALRAAYEQLTAEGVTGLSYLEGDHLLGDDGEGATDASHPNDLGFMRQADAMAAVLKGLLDGR